MSEELFVGSMPDAMVDEMFSETPADNGGADTGDQTNDDAGADVADDTDDTGDVTDQADDTEEPAEEPAESEPAKQPESTDPEKPATDEDVPEGVKVRDRNGRKEWVYPEDRAKSIYEGYKVAKSAEELLGEPLTVEALQERQYSHDWLTNQRVDLISDNPADQGNVFANLFREAAFAMRDGEIGHDPMDTLPDAFISTLQRMAPEKYEEFSNKVIVNNLEALYRKAHASGNEKLLRSVQNLDHHLTGTYRKDDEVAKMTPAEVDTREQRLNEREREIQERDRAAWQQKFKGWHEGVTTNVNATVNEVITAQVPESVRKAFESTPEGQSRLGNISKLLRLEVQESIKADQNWKRQNDNLIKQAKMAPSEERREAIKTQIVQRYMQRARQVISAKAKTIIDAETLGLKQANAANLNRQRVAAAQKGQTPQARPAQRSVPSTAQGGSWGDWIDSL